MIEIRKMQLSDINQLAQLYQLFWNEDSSAEMMRNTFAKLQTNPNYIFLSAMENSDLVGSVSGIICEELYGEDRPFLVVENLIVDRRCRRKGVGTALMAELERIASEKGCYQMLLITEEDRTDAVSFYESLGFDANTHKGFKRPIKRK